MANSIYLQITPKTGPAFKGNCKDKAHVDWIEVTSWETSFSQELAASKELEKGGKPVSRQEDFEFEKFYDKASDDLIKACWTGMELKECVFEVYRAFGGASSPTELAKKDQWYIKITLESAYISSYNIKGGADEIPEETISINYDKFTFEYKKLDISSAPPQLKSSGAPYTHDWATNKGAS